MTTSFPKELKRRTENSHIVRTIEMNLGSNHTQNVYALIKKHTFVTPKKDFSENIHDALLIDAETIAPVQKAKLEIQKKLNIHPSAWDGFLHTTDHIEIIKVINKDAN